MCLWFNGVVASLHVFVATFAKICHCARCFQCKDSNVDLMCVQSRYCRARQTQRCYRLGEITTTTILTLVELSQHHWWILLSLIDAAKGRLSCASSLEGSRPGDGGFRPSQVVAVQAFRLPPGRLHHVLAFGVGRPDVMAKWAFSTTLSLHHSLNSAYSQKLQYN